MSKFLKPSLYSGRAQELQWLNTVIGSHDLMCGCQNPLKHLHFLLQKDNKQLCLPSTEDRSDLTEHGGEDAVDNLLEGDLDKLFEEEFNDDER